MNVLVVQNLIRNYKMGVGKSKEEIKVLNIKKIKEQNKIPVYDE